MARYRHGGAAAFDPAMRSPLVRPVPFAGGAATREGQNVLQFPSPNTRPKRSEKPRVARPKPAAPKKRDS